MPDPTEPTAASIAQSGTNRTDDSSSGGGKPVDSGVAPDAGQGGSKPGADDQAPSPQPPEGQAAESETVVKPEDLATLLDEELGVTPTQNAEQLQRDLAASSKEARRLKANLDAVNKVLAKQGVRAAFKKDGVFAGLMAVAVSEDGKAKSMPDPPKLTDFTSAEQDLFVQDSEEAIKVVYAKAMASAEKHFARPAPTIGDVVEPPSPEVREAAVQGMREAESRGEKVYPEIDAHLPHIDRILENLPEAVQTAYFKHPALMLGLLNDRVSMANQRLLAWAEKQNAKSKETKQRNTDAAAVSPTGKGVVTIAAGGGDAAKSVAHSIAMAEQD